MIENLVRNLMKYGFDQIHAARECDPHPARKRKHYLLQMLRSVHIGTQRVFLVFTAFGTTRFGTSD